jgi:hypothetical protein
MGKDGYGMVVEFRAMRSDKPQRKGSREWCAEPSILPENGEQGPGLDKWADDRPCRKHRRSPEPAETIAGNTGNDLESAHFMCWLKTVAHAEAGATDYQPASLEALLL